MLQEIGLFIASLAAVVAVVGIAHIMGFSRSAQIDSEDEVREVLQLAPGGFEPAEIAVDADHQRAIARDREGRLALVLAHGNKVIARVLGPAAEVRVDAGRLHVVAPELGPKPVRLQLGETARGWATPGDAAR